MEATALEYQYLLKKGEELRRQLVEQVERKHHDGKA